MKKFVVVFDIDNTLFNRENDDTYDGNEWAGSRKLWLDLCTTLKNIALKYNVELNFAIATAKDGVDCLVEEVAQTFNEYLFAFDTKTKLKSPVIHQGCLRVHLEGKPALSTLFSVEDAVYDPESTFVSSIQIATTYKSPSLMKLAELFEVTDYSNVFLVDDNPKVLLEASSAGFSVISAEKVCVCDSDITYKNARDLMSMIENEITKKIMNMQTPAQSLFFTKPPELTPLQISLGAEIVETKPSRRYSLH